MFKRAMIIEVNEKTNLHSQRNALLGKTGEYNFNNSTFRFDTPFKSGIMKLLRNGVIILSLAVEIVLFMTYKMEVL